MLGYTSYMGTIKILKQSEFAKEVLESKVPTVVDFYADWCGPCRAMTPVLERAQAELGGKVNIVKINVDDSEELAYKYKVMSIPTIVIINGGEEVERTIGMLSDQALVDKVNSIIG